MSRSTTSILIQTILFLLVIVFSIACQSSPSLEPDKMGVNFWLETLRRNGRDHRTSSSTLVPLQIGHLS